MPTSPELEIVILTSASAASAEVAASLLRKCILPFPQPAFLSCTIADLTGSVVFPPPNPIPAHVPSALACIKVFIGNPEAVGCFTVNVLDGLVVPMPTFPV